MLQISRVDDILSDHENFYKALESALMDLVKLKKIENWGIQEKELLLGTTISLLDYVESELFEHFVKEEEFLFPEILENSPEKESLLDFLIGEHVLIKNSHHQIKKNIDKLIKNRNLDPKIEILFPAYRLIGTCNHHAQREDLGILGKSIKNL